MKHVLRIASAAVLAMCAIPSFAQSAASNTCTPPAVDAARQGRHTALDQSADGVQWPPNHKFGKPVVLSGSTNAAGHACKIHIDAVKQDEDPQGIGSGSTYPDAQACGNVKKADGTTDPTSASVQVRGERSGVCTSGCVGTTEDSSQQSMGDGRYYHIQYTLTDPDTGVPAKDSTCSDGNGGSQTCEALILVPHDQGVSHTSVDEGALFDSGATCP